MKQTRTGRPSARTGSAAGGDLDVEWAEDDHVYLGGPAAHVFDGELSAAWLDGLAEGARR